MLEKTVTKNKAVSAFGITCPFIREGDNIASIIVDSVLNSGHTLDDMDVIGITESVVARAQGNYVTVDELAEEIQRFVIGKKKPKLVLCYPIYSRNRFSVILRGFARACSKIVIIMPEFDEVGNLVKNHPFTGMDYQELYKSICEEEGCECHIFDSAFDYYKDSLDKDTDAYISCLLHETEDSKLSVSYKDVYSLKDFCKDKCEWGLLGSNKVNEEKLKLFPSKGGAQAVCDMVKESIKEKTGKDVVVCVYGDGAYKDPVSGIWEFADSTTMPGYTDKELIESTPHELKLKELIDNKCEEEIHKALSENDAQKASSMGTTPRMRRDLLASLMDLVSGSGDRATPCVLVKNYF